MQYRIAGFCYIANVVPVFFASLTKLQVGIHKTDVFKRNRKLYDIQKLNKCLVGTSNMILQKLFKNHQFIGLH